MKIKKKNRLLKPLIMALLISFLFPVFAMAATPSEVTFDTKGAILVPTQEQYESFVSKYKNFYYVLVNDKNLQLFGTNSTFLVYETEIKTSDGSDVAFLTAGGTYSTIPIALLGSNNIKGEYLIRESPTEPTDPTDPIEGGENKNMLESLTATSILAESTTWANNFDGLLLVVVGVGIGFACVRFVKSLFF